MSMTPFGWSPRINHPYGWGLDTELRVSDLREDALLQLPLPTLTGVLLYLNHTSFGVVSSQTSTRHQMLTSTLAQGTDPGLTSVLPQACVQTTTIEVAPDSQSEVLPTGDQPSSVTPAGVSETGAEDGLC